MPGSHAFVHGEDPLRFYAENQDVMNRVLGVQLVAQLPSRMVSSAERLHRMQRALREERWADALLDWIDETGRVVDVYDCAPDAFDTSAKVWSEEDIATDRVRELLHASPLFSDD